MGGEIKNNLINNYNRFLPRFSSENILIEPVNPILLIDSDYSGLKEYFPIVKDVTEEDNYILLLYFLKS